MLTRARTWIGSIGSSPELRSSDVLAIMAVGVIYFLLAKAGLTLASIHPSATPVWPPTGLALAAVLLLGYRVWPAIFVAAFFANLTTAGSLSTSLAIAAGNALECVVGGYLIYRWSGGRNTFLTRAGVIRFALLSVLPTAISATIGVGSLTLAGFASQANFLSIWFTWWLGDLAGALLITPVILLWATDRQPARGRLGEEMAIYVVATLVGLVAFSPVIKQASHRGSFAFLAVVPLLWAALRGGRRETATVALILSCFAVWGTVMGSGPFALANLNESFLLLLSFIASASIPSLVLSADVERRKQEHDVTARALGAETEHKRRAEQELVQQGVHLREAQRLASLGSWSWDIASQQVTWSDQLHVIYGVARGEFAGTVEDFIARIHPDDRAEVQDVITRALASGQRFELNERIVRPSGEIRHLASSGEVIKDDRGNVVRMLGICQDVTDRKRNEAALAQAREQLAQAQKMEALGQLTGGISHDFNNLLMIVSGHSHALRRDLTDPKKLRALDAIQAAVDRGASLTRQLLGFSRKQLLNPQTIELSERVRSVREMLGGSVRADIKVVYDLPADLWRVYADPGELDLTIVNIVVNARDAMGQGGCLTLSGRNLTLAPGTVGEQLAGDFVALSVADTGSGIPADVLSKIFEPFFTTKAVGKGTGLGLSQVYGFARQSGGEVSVTSDVGRGTTVTVYLPRSDAPVTASVGEAPAPQDARARGTILVVEDNTGVADVTTALLEQLGYRTVLVEGAAQALDRLRHDGGVNLVLSDIVMPGEMNGIGLANEIKVRYPQLPVVLTTAYNDMIVAAGLEHTILRKPFQLADLEKALREAMRDRLGSTQG